MTYSRIVGTGRYLPERIMTNADLEKIVDTTDEWIRTRTGVERRHVVSEEQTTSDMCVESAKNAMDAAGVTPADIDMVITGTTSPDVVFPNVSTIIQHRLGIPACTAFSLEAACSSFIYALTVADKFIKAGEAKCVVHVPSRRLHLHDQVDTVYPFSFTDLKFDKIGGTGQRDQQEKHQAGAGNKHMPGVSCGKRLPCNENIQTHPAHC